jgi:hypothetical protein
MKNNINTVLERISSDIISDLKDIVIFEIDRNTYELFQKYQIKCTQGAYTIVTKFSNVSHVVSTLKTAVSWCIYDYYGKMYEANLIVDMDRQIYDLENKIKIQEKILQNKKINSEARAVYEIKKESNIRKKQTAVRILANSVQHANYLQRQKFNSKSKLSL